MSDDTDSQAGMNALRRAWNGDDKEQRPGPRRSLSMAQVLDAAIAVYDEWGAEGFSLARLAKAVGLTTNALYRYADSREEIEALVRDRALGWPDLDKSADWRDGVRLWCQGLSARYMRHGWLAEVPVRIPNTPNALAWLDALLTHLQDADLDLASQLAAAGLLDNHVRACAVVRADLAAAATLIPDDFETLLAARGLTNVAAIARAGLYDNPPPGDGGMLAFGLDLFIAGIEARTADGVS